VEILAQAVQARKYFSDGLQAGLQAAQAMLISGNCHCGLVFYQKSLAAGCAMGSGIECITKVLHRVEESYLTLFL
jgi:hypothetical protein